MMFIPEDDGVYGKEPSPQFGSHVSGAKSLQTSQGTGYMNKMDLSHVSEEMNSQLEHSLKGSNEIETPEDGMTTLEDGRR